MLDNLHIFYFCVLVLVLLCTALWIWYYNDGLYCICGYINTVGFFNYIAGEKSCFIFAVEIKFIPNIFAASVELIMHCLIRDCRCWVSFSRNMTHRDLTSRSLNTLKLSPWTNRRTLIRSSTHNARIGLKKFCSRILLVHFVKAMRVLWNSVNV